MRRCRRFFTDAMAKVERDLWAFIAADAAKGCDQQGQESVLAKGSSLDICLGMYEHAMKASDAEVMKTHHRLSTVSAMQNMTSTGFMQKEQQQTIISKNTAHSKNHTKTTINPSSSVPSSSPSSVPSSSPSSVPSSFPSSAPSLSLLQS